MPASEQVVLQPAVPEVQVVPAAPAVQPELQAVEEEEGQEVGGVAQPEEGEGDGGGAVIGRGTKRLQRMQKDEAGGWEVCKK